MADGPHFSNEKLDQASAADHNMPPAGLSEFARSLYQHEKSPSQLDPGEKKGLSNNSSEISGSPERLNDIYSIGQPGSLLKDSQSPVLKHDLEWGAAGAAAGAATAYTKEMGMDFSINTIKSVGTQLVLDNRIGIAGKIVLGAAIGGLAVGTAADLISRASKNSYVQERAKELKQMFASVKNSL